MSKLQELVEMRNKNILVTLPPALKTMTNGLTVEDVRGKREIVIGLVEVAEASLKLPERCMAYFPLYAALPVELGEIRAFVVPFQDILMIEKI